MKLKKIGIIATLLIVLVNCVLLSGCDLFNNTNNNDYNDDNNNNADVYTSFALNYSLQVLDRDGVSSDNELFQDASFSFLNSTFSYIVDSKNYDTSTKFSNPGNLLQVEKSFAKNSNFNTTPNLISIIHTSYEVHQGSQITLGNFSSQLKNNKVVISSSFSMNSVFRATYSPTNYVYTVNGGNVNNPTLTVNTNVWIKDGVFENQPNKIDDYTICYKLDLITNLNAPQVALIISLS